MGISGDLILDIGKGTQRNHERGTDYLDGQRRKSCIRVWKDCQCSTS